MKCAEVDSLVKLKRTFRSYLIVCAVGLLVSGVCRYIAEVAEVAMIAFEGVIVLAAGILIVTGIYLQGFEEGIEWEKRNKE